MKVSGSILLFDGLCNLCSGLVRFIMARDRGSKIRHIPFQSAEGLLLLKKLGIADNDVDSVIYIVKNKHFLRSSAVLHLLRELRGGWRLFYGFIIIPESIRDFFYNLIASRRYKIFGKRDTCMVPVQEKE